MRRAFRNRTSLLRRAITLLMAAYLFNFSIDSRDACSDVVAEDLSVNDIESVYEFLAEGILGLDNAVQEHDERDQEDGGSFEFKKFFFSSVVRNVQAKAASLIKIQYSTINYCDSLVMWTLEIHSPPPQG